jgi:hypothetical protein
MDTNALTAGADQVIGVGAGGSVSGAAGSVAGSQRNRWGVPPSASSSRQPARAGWMPATRQSRYWWASTMIRLVGSAYPNPSCSPVHPERSCGIRVAPLRSPWAASESISGTEKRTACVS